MATIQDLMGAGIPASPASLLGESRLASISAASTTQALGYKIKATVTTFTTVTASSAEAATLPTKAVMQNDDIVVINNGLGILRVFPPVGGTINSLAINTSFAVPQGGIGRFKRISNTLWEGITSGQTALSGITAAGTTIADAFQLTTTHTNVTTTAAGTGVIVTDTPVGTLQFIRNGGANALLVYPPTATNFMNAGSAGAAVSVATLATVLVMRVTPGTAGIFMACEAPAA